MLLDRRQFLLTSTSVAGAVALPGKLFAQPAASGSPQLAALFDALFKEQLRQNPEGATQLGLDKGPNADLRGKLVEADDAARASARALTQSQLARLQAISARRAERLRPPQPRRRDLHAAIDRRRAEVRLRRLRRSARRLTSSRQLTGAYQSMPDFLDTKHTIETRSRRRRLSVAPDGVRRRSWTTRPRGMKHDAGLGVVAAGLHPRHHADPDGEDAARARRPRSLLVTSIARRAAAKGLGDALRRATRRGSTTSKVAARRWTGRSPRRRRCARAPSTMPASGGSRTGAEFYEAALHNTTTTRLTPGRGPQARASTRRGDLRPARRPAEGAGPDQGHGRRADGRALQGPEQLYPEHRRRQGAGDRLLQRAAGGDPAAAAAARSTACRTYQFEVRRVPPQTEAGAASAF